MNRKRKTQSTNSSTRNRGQSQDARGQSQVVRGQSQVARGRSQVAPGPREVAEVMTNARMRTPMTLRPLQERVTNPQENRRNTSGDDATKTSAKRAPRRPSFRIIQPQRCQRVRYVPQIVSVAPMPRTTVNPTIYSPETMFGTEAVYNQPSFQFMEQALPDAFPAYCSQDDVGEWPSDLDELVANWDEEGNVWDVIKWLPAPTHTAVPTPRMVTYVQEMMSEWDEAFDNKCLQVMEWLGYPDVASPQVEPPKVVVEAQPSSSQAYNQWSSMNEHT